jgi:hypothetical protein
VKRIMAYVIAVSVALLLVTPGIAEAHVATFSTNLTLRASDKTVEKGDVVKFTAKLSSAKKQCFQNKRVQLLKDGDRVATKRTNDRGKAVFQQTIRRTATWKARFTGFRFGRHPHVHRCQASTSNSIRVRVLN